MPKGQPRRPAVEYTLTWALQVRRHGMLTAEFKFTGQQCECLSYLPNGQLSSHGKVSLDDFIKITQEVRDGQYK